MYLCYALYKSKHRNYTFLNNSKITHFSKVSLDFSFSFDMEIVAFKMLM